MTKKKPGKKSRKKRGGRGRKVKGNTFERKIAKKLSTWWGEDFRRTPNSGAIRWHGTNVPWIYGDIVPPPSFKGVIECKSYRDLNLQLLLTGTPSDGNILGFWGQACTDAERATDALGEPVEPFLVAKANYSPPLLGISYRLAQALHAGPNPLCPESLFVIREDVEPFLVVKLDSFLELWGKPLVLGALDDARRPATGTRCLA